MKLSYEEIKSLTCGYVECEIVEKGINFYRMGKRQTELFGRADPNGKNSFIRKCMATAGIRFDFYTRSTEFSFSYTNASSASSRSWYYFDVFVNGKRKGTVGEEKPLNGGGRFFLKLDGRWNRITVFFPNLFRATIESVELSSEFLPFKPRGRLLVYGDSIAQGYDAKLSGESFANAYAYGTDSEIINLAIGGSTAYPAAIDSGIDYSADAVLVAYGTNDWKHKSKGAFCADFQEFFTRLSALYESKCIYAVLPVIRLDCNLVTEVGGFCSARQTIAEIAERFNNVTVIDSIEFLPMEEEMFSDGYLHPNEEGFRHYTQGLFHTIGNLWEK